MLSPGKIQFKQYTAGKSWGYVPITMVAKPANLIPVIFPKILSIDESFFLVVGGSKKTNFKDNTTA